MKIDPHLALSDTGFLFHASTGDSFSVNPVGLKIIKLIKEGQDQASILTSLEEQFEVDTERAEEDLADFLQYLRQLKIVLDEH